MIHISGGRLVSGARYDRAQRAFPVDLRTECGPQFATRLQVVSDRFANGVAWRSMGWIDTPDKIGASTAYSTRSFPPGRFNPFWSD